jgi:hypothetical protein
MRRRSLSWLLSLLLLLTQHGAVLHELSHFSHGSVTAGASLHTDGNALDSASCPTCHAFSQAGNAVSSNPAGLAVSLAEGFCVPDPHYGIASTDAPPPRSRGPPQV